MNTGTDTLVMWGERGLVATMLIDLSRGSAGKNWAAFFQACNFQSPCWSSRKIESVSVVVEPDFSNEGFGHPDAIVRLEFEGGVSAVVILEAKRTAYAKASAPPSNRGGIGYNSVLNGQLELNHCLALALSGFTEHDSELREPEWILHSPYNIDRRNKLRRLKNRAVIAQIVRPFSGLPFRSYFHLIITTDPSNPFENSDCKGLWPELYHPDYPFNNCWNDLRPQFGWASWGSIENTMIQLASIEDGSAEYIFLPTLEANRRNFRLGLGAAVTEESSDELAAILDTDLVAVPDAKSSSHSSRIINRGTRGATMIFAPSIDPSTFLHFSWLNDSCALRDYGKSPNIMPFEDRSRRASEVIAKITREVPIRKRSPISDTRYWHETTQNLNKTELAALIQGQPLDARGETSDALE